MKDFYKRLNLNYYYNEKDDINSRLSELPYDDKAAIVHILLHDGRKRVYDKINRTLKQIGILRNLFGNAIDDEFWGPEYADFNIPVREYADTIQKKKKRRWVKILFGFSPVIIIGVIIFISSISTERKTTVSPPISPSSDYESQPQVNKDTSDSQQEPTSDEQELTEYERFKDQHPLLELPETGVLRSSFSEGLAKFTIITPNTGDHYYIKVLEIGSNKDILYAFIKSGEKFETDIPLGTYKLKYAVGQEWFGEQYRFGPNTNYVIADDDFVFEKMIDENGISYSWWTVELFRQAGGNLPVYEIPEEKF